MDYLIRFTVENFPLGENFTTDGGKTSFKYSVDGQAIWGIFDHKKNCFVDINSEGRPHVGYTDKGTSALVADGWNDTQDCKKLGIFPDTFRGVIFWEYTEK